MRNDIIELYIRARARKSEENYMIGTFDDEILPQIIEWIGDSSNLNISVSLLQRRFSIGYARASKLFDRLKELEIVYEDENSNALNKKYGVNTAKAQEYLLNRDVPSHREKLRDDIQKLSENSQPEYEAALATINAWEENINRFRTSKPMVSYGVERIIKFCNDEEQISSLLASLSPEKQVQAREKITLIREKSAQVIEIVERYNQAAASCGKILRLAQRARDLREQARAKIYDALAGVSGNPNNDAFRNHWTQAATFYSEAEDLLREARLEAQEIANLSPEVESAIGEMGNQREILESISDEIMRTNNAIQLTLKEASSETDEEGESPVIENPGVAEEIVENEGNPISSPKIERPASKKEASMVIVDERGNRYSSVTNEVKLMQNGEPIKDNEGKDIVVHQGFTMTNREEPLIEFSAGDENLGKIISDEEGNYYLQLNAKAIESLPEEVKNNMTEIDGQMLFEIQPSLEGTPSPISIGTKTTNETQVQIKSKDGGTPYTCIIGATGISVKFGESSTRYQPKDAEGQPQIIDLSMSTVAFENMISADGNMIEMEHSKDDAVPPHGIKTHKIPSFMLGTYLEATNDLEEGKTSTSTKVIEGTSLSTFALRLPDPNNEGQMVDYYFINDNSTTPSKTYTLDNGLITPLVKSKEYYYRCRSEEITSGKGKKAKTIKKITEPELVIKRGQYYRSIALPIDENQQLPEEVATALKEWQAFVGKEPLTRQAEGEQKTSLTKAGSGLEIRADLSDTNVTKSLDPKVKGAVLEENQEQEKTIEPPPPPPPQPKKPDPPKTKEIKQKKFDSSWGILAMGLGLFIVLGAIMLAAIAPVFAPILLGIGAAAFVAGGVYYTASGYLSNPFIQVKRQYIEPLKQKEVEENAALQAFQEHDNDRSVSQEESQNAQNGFLQDPIISDILSLFPEDQAEGLKSWLTSEDNIERRDDLSSALEEFMGSTFEFEEEKESKQNEIIQSYLRNADSKLFDDTMLSKLRTQIFGDSSDASKEKLKTTIDKIKSLNEKQRKDAAVRLKTADDISKLSKKDFEELLTSGDGRFSRNAQAIAQRILTGSYSQEQMKKLFSALPSDDARNTLKVAIEKVNNDASLVAMQRQDISTQQKQASMLKTYQTVLTELENSENTRQEVKTAMADYQFASSAQRQEELLFAQFREMGLAPDDPLIKSLRTYASTQPETQRIQSAIEIRNEHLKECDFFDDSAELSMVTMALTNSEASRVVQSYTPNRTIDQQLEDIVSTSVVLGKPLDANSPIGKAYLQQRETQRLLSRLIDPSQGQLISGMVQKEPSDKDVETLRTRLKKSDNKQLSALANVIPEGTLKVISAYYSAGGKLPIEKAFDLFRGKNDNLRRAMQLATHLEAQLGAMEQQGGVKTEKETREKLIQMLKANSSAETDPLKKLTAEQRGKVLEISPSRHAESTIPAVREIVGKETLPDGRTLEQAVEDEVDPDHIKEEVDREEKYRRKSLQRKLGKTFTDKLDKNEHKEEKEFAFLRRKRTKKEEKRAQSTQELSRKAKEAEDYAAREIALLGQAKSKISALEKQMQTEEHSDEYWMDKYKTVQTEIQRLFPDNKKLLTKLKRSPVKDKLSALKKRMEKMKKKQAERVKEAQEAAGSALQNENKKKHINNLISDNSANAFSAFEAVETRRQEENQRQNAAQRETQTEQQEENQAPVSTSEAASSHDAEADN